MKLQFKIKTAIALTCLLILCFLMVKCDSYEEKEATDIVNGFFYAYKNDNMHHILAYYPNIRKIEYGRQIKSDNIKIQKITLNKDKSIDVCIISYWTNLLEETFSKEIIFKIKKTEYGEYKIYDSKGFFYFDEGKIYKYGIRKGMIMESDDTDQKMGNKLLKVHKIFSDRKNKLFDIVVNAFKITSYRWEKIDYINSAHGSAIVQNISELDIPYVKYYLVYKDRRGNEVVSDNGYISYDIFRAKKTKSFTFYTDYVANASKMSIRISFGDEINDWIDEMVANIL
jgi:hypothetical protein